MPTIIPKLYIITLYNIRRGVAPASARSRNEPNFGPLRWSRHRLTHIPRRDVTNCNRVGSDATTRGCHQDQKAVSQHPSLCTPAEGTPTVTRCGAEIYGTRRVPWSLLSVVKFGIWFWLVTPSLEKLDKSSLDQNCKISCFFLFAQLENFPVSLIQQYDKNYQKQVYKTNFWAPFYTKTCFNF